MLIADSAEKDRKQLLKLPESTTFSDLYGIEELNKKGKAESIDFLDQYDNLLSTDINLDNILGEQFYPKKVSSLEQRHRNPKCQAHTIQYSAT